MMTTVADDLRKARELIADPKDWVQRNYAEDASGWPVSINDYAACRWCAFGAVAKITGVAGIAAMMTPAGALLTRSARELFPKNPWPPEVNDTLGHPAVLRMYDRAIELASEDSQP